MKIGEDGRTVRCAACAHVWRAERQAVQPEPVASPEFDDDDIDPISGAMANSADATGHGAASGQGGKANAHGFVPPPMPPTEAHMPTAPQRGLAAWGGGAGIVVGILAAAILFRAEMVQVWPKSASVYAMVGLSPTISGLQIDKGSIAARRELGPDGEGLRVTALVRNPSKNPLPAPFVQLQVRDARGRVVLQQRGALDQPLVGARQVSRLSFWVPNAPADGVDVELRLTEAFPQTGYSPTGATPNASDPVAGTTRPNTPRDT